MEAAANNKPTVLVVDDEETALLLRKLVLEKSGFRVLTVSSGAKALELLATTPVDLVLSDLLMPKMLGTELARRLKEERPELPVVIISGVNEIPQEASFADMFISKLEGPVALAEKLHKVLNQSRATASSS